MSVTYRGKVHFLSRELKRQGFTYGEIAKKIGVSREQLYRIRKGLTVKPRRKTKGRITRRYNVEKKVITERVVETSKDWSETTLRKKKGHFKRAKNRFYYIYSYYAKLTSPFIEFYNTDSGYLNDYNRAKDIVQGEFEKFMKDSNVLEIRDAGGIIFARAFIYDIKKDKVVFRI